MLLVGFFTQTCEDIRRRDVRSRAQHRLSWSYSEPGGFGEFFVSLFLSTFSSLSDASFRVQSAREELRTGIPEAAFRVKTRKYLDSDLPAAKNNQVEVY